jgi:WD40 repeat protein
LFNLSSHQGCFMPDVFISYSRKNREFVAQIHKALAAQNRDIWIDWEDIPFTADWWGEICSGIESADTFIFIMTPDSLSSPVCMMEVDHAMQHGKRLVPVTYTPPDEKSAFAALASKTLDDNTRKALAGRDMQAIARENWNALARHNWLYFKEAAEFDTNFQQLVSAIDTDLDHAREHTRLLIRAREWDRKNRAASFLLDGAAISEAEKWLTQGVSKLPTPTRLHAEYIAASRKAESRQQQTLLTGVSIALVVSLGLALLSFVLFQQAERSREVAVAAQVSAQENANAAVTAQEVAVAAQATAERRAEESNSNFLAQRAQSIIPVNPFLGYALAIEAVSVENPPALAQQAFASVAYNTGAVRRFEHRGTMVTALAFSADGSTVFAAGMDNTITRFDVATGAILETFTFEDAVFGAFSENGQYAVLQLNNGALIIVDTATGERLRELSGQPAAVNLLAFSADGRYLISATGAPPENSTRANPISVIVWDVETGRQVREFSRLETPVQAVALSGDGSLAAATLSASEDGTSRAETVIWDVASGQAQHTWDNGGLELAFTADGSWLISRTEGPMIVWNLDLNQPMFSWSEEITSSPVFSPNHDYVAYGGADNTLFLWRSPATEERQPFTEAHAYQGHGDMVNAIAFSPDGRYVVSGALDGSTILWDVTTPADETTIPFDITPNEGGAISPNFEQVALISGGGIQLRSATSGGFQVLDGTYRSVIFSPDGQMIFAGGDEGVVVTLGVEAEANVAEFVRMEGAVGGIAFQPDGQAVLIGDATGVLVLFDMTGAEIRRFGAQESGVSALAFSADGTLALSGSDDGSVSLWDVATGELVRSLSGHSARVMGVAFSADGRYALTGDADGVGMLWEVATGTALHTLSGSGTFTSNIVFNDDSTRVLAGFSDGSMMLWEVATGTALRTFLNHSGAVVTIRLDGERAWSLATDGSFVISRMDTLPQIVDWLMANHDIPELDCQQRLSYSVTPYCEDDGAFPTRTPYPTLTPSP